MATCYDITTGVQTVSAAGAFSGTLDISSSTYGFASTTDVTLCVEVLAMTDGKGARLELQDSVNAFTTPLCVWSSEIYGKIGQGGTSYTAGAYAPTTSKTSVRKYQVPNMRVGTSSAVVRLYCTAIDGSSSLTVHAWLEA